MFDMCMKDNILHSNHKPIMSATSGSQSTPTQIPGKETAIVNAAEQFMSQLPKLGHLSDRFGNSFNFGNAGEFWLPPFPIGSDNDYRRHVKHIREMEIRDDDVLICSYPKTGLHWHLEIIKMLMSKSSNLKTANTLNTRECFLEQRAVSNWDKKESPRILFTHVPFRFIPKQALKKKIKIIYLDRNPKDVLVSYYNHMHKHVAPLNYPGTFEQFFHLSLEVGYYYGDIFDYLLEWQNGREHYPEVPFYTSIYENMKMDPVQAIKELNIFLNTGCSDELCEEIALASSFDSVKKYKDDNATPFVKALFVDSKPGLFRKGDVGDWENWFTVAMNEEFDNEYKTRMADYKTVYKYTL
ncbi:Sulfotransferase cytosolic 1B member 1 [Bulinus truncatus]|nr:Sulfotransferase cytosolic 1B member 1 [Bulinus truncatus]